MWPFPLRNTSTLLNKWNFWLSRKQCSSWFEHTLPSVSLWPWSCDLLFLTFLIICCNLEGPARSVHTLRAPCLSSHYSGICALNAMSLPWPASGYILTSIFQKFPLFIECGCMPGQTEMCRWTALTTNIINTELPCHIWVREKVYTCPFLQTDKIRHKGEKKCQRW